MSTNEKQLSSGQVAVEPSLDLLFEQVNAIMASQDAQVGALDTKGGFVLGSASLLIGGVAAFQSAFAAALPKLAANSVWLWVAFALILAGLATYLWLVWCSYQAYRIRGYDAIAEVGTLRDKYLLKKPEETKGWLLDSMVETIEKNTKTIDEKANWAEKAVLALLIEAGFVAVLVVVQFIVQAFV